MRERFSKFRFAWKNDDIYTQKYSAPLGCIALSLLLDSPDSVQYIHLVLSIFDMTQVNILYLPNLMHSQEHVECKPYVFSMKRLPMVILIKRQKIPVVEIAKTN